MARARWWAGAVWGWCAVRSVREAEGGLRGGWAIGVRTYCVLAYWGRALSGRALSGITVNLLCVIGMCAIGRWAIGMCAIGIVSVLLCALSGWCALYAVRYRDPSPFTLCAIGMCAIGMCAIGHYGQFTVCYR